MSVSKLCVCPCPRPRSSRIAPGPREALLAALAEVGVRDLRALAFQARSSCRPRCSSRRPSAGRRPPSSRCPRRPCEVLVGALEVLGGHLGDRVVGRDGLLKLCRTPRWPCRAVDRLQNFWVAPVPPAPRPGGPQGRRGGTSAETRPRPAVLICVDSSLSSIPNRRQQGGALPSLMRSIGSRAHVMRLGRQQVEPSGEDHVHHEDSTPTNHAERPLLVIIVAVSVAISIITTAPARTPGSSGSGP